MKESTRRNLVLKLLLLGIIASFAGIASMVGIARGWQHGLISFVVMVGGFALGSLLRKIFR